MAIGPSINTDIRSIAFPIVSTDASPIYTMAPLAPAIGAISSTGYVYGQLLAQYTAGSFVGQFVNYDSVSGTNGANIFVGVLMDDLFVPGPTVSGQVQIAVMLTKGAFIKSQLAYTQIADVAAAVTQRNAKTVYDYNATGTYLIYGL
jgi:hypothetical protein